MKIKLLLFSIIILIFTSSFISSNDESFQTYLIEYITKSEGDIIIYTPCLSSDKIVNSINKKASTQSITVILESNSLNYSYSKHYNLDKSVNIYINNEFILNNSFILNKNTVLFGNYSLVSDQFNENTYIIKTDNNDFFSDCESIMKHIIANASLFSSFSDTVYTDEVLNNLQHYADKYITVSGTVTDVYNSKKSNTCFLKLDNSNFTIVIFADILEEMKLNSINPFYFLNQTVFITGTFINHKQYGPEIILLSPTHITH